MASDSLLKAFAARLGRAHPDEATLRPPPGPKVTTGLHVLDADAADPVRKGHLVDIAGASSAGKTVVLHALAAHALLSHADPRRVAAVWFCLNGGFNLSYLTAILRAALQQIVPPSDVEARLTRCLAALRLSQPESTVSLTDSILALPAFLNSDEGSAVSAVFIDALGTFHYTDKFNAAANSTVSAEFPLINALKSVLSLRKVTVYASKSALFEADRLSVHWPFPEAGVPKYPRDIMPPAWKGITSHVLLIYVVKEQQLAVQAALSHRALVSMVYRDGPGATRKLEVIAAGTATIGDTGLHQEPGGLHLARTQPT